MKSITIHGLDDHVAKMLKVKAKEKKESDNKTVKRMIEQALGVKAKEQGAHYKDSVEFCGTWSKEDLAEFEKNSAEIRKVDEELWR